MKQLKRLLVVLLSVSMCMTLLMGCSSKDDKKNSASQAPSVAPTTNPTNEATVAPAETTAPTKNPNIGTVTGAKEGTYKSTIKGYASDVTATVTIGKQGNIQDIKVDATGETETVGQAAAPTFAKNIVEKQNLDVDIVSGATYTCTAILQAVEDALQQAGVDTTNLK